MKYVRGLVAFGLLSAAVAFGGNAVAQDSRNSGRSLETELSRMSGMFSGIEVDKVINYVCRPESGTTVVSVDGSLAREINEGEGACFLGYDVSFIYGRDAEQRYVPIAIVNNGDKLISLLGDFKPDSDYANEIVDNPVVVLFANKVLEKELEGKALSH